MNSSPMLARTSVAPVPALPYSTPTWDDWVAAMLDPINQTGSTDPLSRNFHWGVGLVGLPGRAGLDAGLSLNYNSLVWTRFDTSMAFDLDSGFPSPGFRLGFPVIYGPHTNAAASVSAYLLISPSGGRVELRQIGSTNVYESADSAHLQMIDNGDGTLLVRGLDGTRWAYTGTANGYRVTEIKDTNGNYLTITNDSAGRLQTMTDTLGRVFTVHYDSNNNPTSISQTRGSSQYTWVTFGYEEIEFTPEFRDREIVTELKSWTLPVLTQVNLPDGTYYKFEYNSFAQVSKVSYYAADSESDDHLLNCIANDLDDAISGSPSDVPRIGSISVLAENWNLDGSDDPQEVTTTFSEPEVADCDGSGSGTDCQLSVVTAPNGTEQHTFTRVAGDWDYGLPVREETWGLDESSSFVKQRWVTSLWTQDNTSVDYLLNPRVTDTSIFDNSNQKRTTISYQNLSVGCGSGCSTDIHLPESVAEYAANATTVLRTTETDFLESSNYLDRRIIGLPVETRVYDGTNNGTLMAKTGIYYDETGYLTSQGSGISRFDATNYGSTFYYRGNVTTTRRYEMGTSNHTDSHLGYNTTGSVILAKDALDHETEIEYSSTYQLAYPTKITDPDGNDSIIAFDIYTGLKTSAKGPDLSGSLVSAHVEFEYDTIGRLVESTTMTGTTAGANTLYYYGTNSTNVTTYSTIKDLSTYTVAATNTDGLGRTIATATEHPGSSGGYKAQVTRYDAMGRVDRTSNPTEISGGFSPYGDDSAGWIYSYQTYDWKGRPRITTNQDSTTKEISYGGCGCAGGEVVTVRDEGTMISSTLTRRKQVSYKDVLGRVIKVENYDWDGTTVNQTTATTFNVLDQPTQVRQYAGAVSSGTFQDTTFIYDGYGRLHQQHRPEQFELVGISLIPSNTYTTFEYNADDTRSSVTDGRGASASYTYNNRHQVTEIEYAAPSGITVPDPTEFTYDDAGNRTSMTDNSGDTDYVYNALSQMVSETRHFNRTLAGAPETGNGFKLQYTYTVSGQLASLTDPYGDEIEYTHDNLGRLTDVTGSSFGGITTYAESAQYRAWDAPKSMDYGDTLGLTMTFNQRLQAATFKISKTGLTLIEKDYEYGLDGRLNFSEDINDDRFDHKYGYGPNGEMSTVDSGVHARGGTGSRDDIPFDQTYGYDTFGHINARDTWHWTENFGWSKSFTNNRGDGWDYDAEGRPTRVGSTTDNDELFTVYDAAGRIIQTTATASNRTDQDVDGDGRPVEQVKYSWNATTSSFDTAPTSDILFIRSTVLGGQTVSEAAGRDYSTTVDAGDKARTFVHAGGAIIAEQDKGYGSADVVYWHHSDASGTTLRVRNAAGGTFSEMEMDPMGRNAGTISPYITPGPPDDNPDSSLLFPYAPTIPHQRPDYIVDGMPVGQEFFDDYVESDMVGGALGLIEIYARASRIRFSHWSANDEDGNEIFEISRGENDRLPHLEDEAFEASGQLTKNWIRNRNRTWVFLNQIVPAKPVAQNADFRGFSSDDLSTLREAVTEGSSLLAGSDCQKKLAKAGIDIGKLNKAYGDIANKINSSHHVGGYNIYNAETTKNQAAIEFLKTPDGRAANAFVLDGDKNVFIRAGFFGSHVAAIDAKHSRALALIHEAIHVAGYKDDKFNGSTYLDDLVIKSCYRPAYGHNDLSIVGN